jgi:DNA polymerase
MSEEFQQLKRAAKQLIEGDRLLAGDGLAPGTPLPEQKKAPDSFSDDAKRKAVELEAIDANEVRGCTKCGLCKGRNKTVFGEGNPDADLFFIGEGPGAEEDKQGRPFIGRAGELLTKMITAMGLTRQDVFIGNIVKCRPPGNRAPMADEVEACLDYLIRQLRIIQPKVIVTLGNPATHTMLNTKVGITRLRGQWQSLPMLDADLAGIKVMPTFHPAFVLRQYTQDNRRKVWSDLQEVMRELS